MRNKTSEIYRKTQMIKPHYNWLNFVSPPTEGAAINTWHRIENATDRENMQLTLETCLSHTNDVCRMKANLHMYCNLKQETRIGYNLPKVLGPCSL